MKKTYTRKQIKKAISFWEKKLVNESLSSGTEAKLKDAAKRFAKWFGEQIKSGQAQRFEDGNYDALVAIKKTIKLNSSAKNMIKFLKSPEAQGIVPSYAIESVAEAGSKAFVANVFDGSKALVEELNRAIDVLENYHFEATEDYVEALAKALQDEKDKKLQNLKKSTEQFNYFANCVFGIWRRDPEIAQTLGRIPKLPETAKDLDDLRSEFNDPEDSDDGDDEDISEYLHDSEEVDEDDMLKKSPHNGNAQHNAHVEENEEQSIPEDEFMAVSEDDDKEEKQVSEAEMKGNIVGALIDVLQRNCEPSDQLLFRMNPSKEECFVFDVYSKNGYAVIDLVKGRPFDPKDL